MNRRKKSSEEKEQRKNEQKRGSNKKSREKMSREKMSSFRGRKMSQEKNTIGGGGNFFG